MTEYEAKMNEHEWQSRENIKSAMAILMREANKMGNERNMARAMFESMSGEHRTIHQSFMKSLASALSQYAEFGEHYSDARNAAAVHWAGEVAKIEDHFPFI